MPTKLTEEEENEIRRFLYSIGVDFKEDKGWIESVFYIKCTNEEFDKLYPRIRQAYEQS